MGSARQGRRARGHGRPGGNPVGGHPIRFRSRAPPHPPPAVSRAASPSRGRAPRRRASRALGGLLTRLQWRPCYLVDAFVCSTQDATYVNLGDRSDLYLYKKNLSHSECFYYAQLYSQHTDSVSVTDVCVEVELSVCFQLYFMAAGLCCKVNVQVRDTCIEMEPFLPAETV